MAKKNNLKSVVDDLFVDLSPEEMTVMVGKGKKAKMDAEATYANVTVNLAYYRGVLDAFDAVAGMVDGLSDAVAEQREAYDVLFAFASENLEEQGFSEFCEEYGIESFGTDENGEEGDYWDLISSYDVPDLKKIARKCGVKVAKSDTVDTILEKMEEAEVDDDALGDVLSELGYLEEDDENEEADAEDEEEAGGYDDMSLGELRKECKERGIKYTPKEKEDALIAKLEADDEENGEDESTDDEEEVDYSAMSLAELRAECKERGIKYAVKQKAADLIALLEEADAEDEEEAGGYDDMSLGELRKECKERGIKYTPKEKEDALIAKLEADDEENGEDESTDDEEVTEDELDEILDEEFEDETLATEEKAEKTAGKGSKKGGKRK